MDRVDGHGVISRAADKVVRIGKIHADAVVALHVVEVAAIGPNAQRPAIPRDSAETRAPEGGTHVLNPHIIHHPIGAGGINGAVIVVVRPAVCVAIQGQV